MDMIISLPVSPTVSVKTSPRSLADKSEGSTFGQVLESTYQKSEAERETTVTEETPLSSMIMATAIFGLFQPATVPQDSSPAAPSSLAAPKSPITVPDVIAESFLAVNKPNALVVSAVITEQPAVLDTKLVPQNLTLTANKKTGDPTSQGFPSNPSIDAHNAISTPINLTAARPEPMKPIENVPAHNHRDNTLSYETPLTGFLETHHNKPSNVLSFLTNHSSIQSSHPQQLAQMVQMAQYGAVPPGASAAPMNSANAEQVSLSNGSMPQPSPLLHGVVQKETNDWQFSEFQKGSDQIELAKLPAPIDNYSNGGSFQSLMDKQLGVNQPKTILSQPPQSQSVPTDKYDIASQIVEHVKLIARPLNTEMVIKLRPEHLGELTFKVAVDQGVVSATFHSNNAEIRSIIEASLPQLKQELSGQGIKLDNIGVFAGMDQFLSGDQRGGQQYQQADIPAVRKNNAKFAETFTEIVTSDNQSTSADGVDYRV